MDIQEQGSRSVALINSTVQASNQTHSGMMSAAASLGLSLLWDTDIGLSHVDKYTYSSEEHIKAINLEFVCRSSVAHIYSRLGPSLPLES